MKKIVFAKTAARRTCSVSQLSLFVAAFASFASFAAAQPAHFAVDGQLVSYDGTTVQKRAAKLKAGSALRSNNIKTIWGTLADGRVLASVGPASIFNEDTPGQPPGDNLVLLKDDGSVDVLVYPTALRAFPSPVGNTVAVITADRNLEIWHDGALDRFEIDGKVSHLSWSTDGRRAVLAVYPADWSPAKVDSAPTSDEFFRLQNADIYLADMSTRKVLSQLTNDPGTEYNPFFSPDGRDVYYIWLHIKERDGGLMKLTLDLDGGTRASRPPQQITKAGDEAGEVPLGRVGTYMWSEHQTGGQRELVFEAGTPRGQQPAGEIWNIRADGNGAKRMALGRHPQKVAGGRVAFLGPDKQAKALDPATANLPADVAENTPVPTSTRAAHTR